MFHDIRYGIRKMVRSPGFTLVVAGSLALGIGANAAVFSLADTMLLRPLPVERPAEVVTVRSRDQNRAVPIPASNSYLDYVDYRDRSQSFEHLLAFDLITASLKSHEDAVPHLTFAVLASGNFFTALGVEPALGRSFRPEEDLVAGRNPVAVLSHGAWVTTWGADPGVLGRTLRLNGITFTIIGVAPESFWGMDLYNRPTVYVPVTMASTLFAVDGQRMIERRDARGLNIRGRLKAGVSVAEAEAELNAVAAELERTYPETNRAERVAVRTELQSRFESTPSDSAIAMIILALSLLVLVIACANVANLLLGRSAARGGEIAVRLAAGAGRVRLLRQLVTESVLLALLGGALSLPLAALGVQFFASLPIASDLPIVMDVRLDHRVLLYSLAASVGSVLVFGLVPAWKATRTDLVSSLRTRGSGLSGTGASRTSRVLVVAQVALSLVLLMAAGSMTLGLDRITRTDAGFRTSGLLLATFAPGIVRYTSDQSRAFYRRIVDDARSIPGVTSVALGTNIPLANRPDRLVVVPEGYTIPRGGRSVSIWAGAVDASYFGTLGVSILRGRAFTEDDRDTSRLVVIVNEDAARKYWPGQDALGKRMRVGGPDGPWAEVVGVARRHLYSYVGEPPREFVYRPFAQSEPRPTTVLLEFAGDPTELANAVRGVVRTLDANMPIFDMRTMEDLYAMRAVAEPRMKKIAVGAMALLGLALALVGLYGVMAHSVMLRRREMGVRIAVGASGGQVLRMVMRQGLGLTLAGVAFGVAAGLAAGSFVGAFVFGATTAEPLAVLIIPCALLAVAAMATLLPARRAARVDPVHALRSE